MQTNCTGSDIVVERGLTDFEEVKREFKDVDKDGLEDLLVTIQRAHTNGSDALGKKVDAFCQKSGDMMQEPKSFLGKYKRYQLEFRGDATTMVPTPETAKQIEQWSQTAPEFWWNIVK